MFQSFFILVFFNFPTVILCSGAPPAQPVGGLLCPFSLGRLGSHSLRWPPWSDWAWNKWILVWPSLHSSTEPGCFLRAAVLTSLLSLRCYIGGTGWVEGERDEFVWRSCLLCVFYLLLCEALYVSDKWKALYKWMKSVFCFPGSHLHALESRRSVRFSSKQA